MATFEESVKRLTSGFTSEHKSSKGRERIVGTKKTGFLERDQRILILGLRSLPTSQDLDWFFKEAEKFYKDNSTYNIVGIYLLTPSEVDKTQFKSLLSRTDDDVARKINSPKVFEPEPQAGPSPVPTLRTETVAGLRRPEDSDERLVSRGPHERVLYEWEMVYEEASRPPVPVIAAVTQERCVLFQRVGGNLLALGVEIKWDSVTHVEAATLGESSVVNINDGKRIHRLHHTDAPYIARLIHHLQWTRQGYLTGFAEIYEWDSGLREAVRQPLLSLRYPTALRDGFSHVEAEIRSACNLPDGTPTRETLSKAFTPSTGLFSFGRNPGEQSGLYDFVTGSFALYRNASAHEAGVEGLDLKQTIEALGIANAILTLLARGREAARKRPLIKPHGSVDSRPPDSAEDFRQG